MMDENKRKTREVSDFMVEKSASDRSLVQEI